MRIASVVLLLSLFLVLPYSAFAQGDIQAGKARWESVAENRCQYCHGMKGEGAFGPDLAGRQISFEQFKQAVRKPWGIMPAFPESQISDQILLKSRVLLTIMRAAHALGRLDGRRGLAITSDYLCTFFDVHLKGSPRSALDALQSKYPEVSVE